MNHRQLGFSLVELLAVIVIIGIISAIAISLYKESLPDAYAPEAEAVLASIVTAAQRCRIEHGNSFSNCDIDTLKNNYAVDTGSTDKWTFAISSASANSFTVVATGQGPVAGKQITLNFDLDSTPHETKTYNW